VIQCSWSLVTKLVAWRANAIVELKHRGFHKLRKDSISEPGNRSAAGRQWCVQALGSHSGVALVHLP
jgi:hypothetical protein